jgi:hypothetical protein
LKKRALYHRERKRERETLISLQAVSNITFNQIRLAVLLNFLNRSKFRVSIFITFTNARVICPETCVCIYGNKNNTEGHFS